MIYFLKRANGDIKIGFTSGAGNGRIAELERRYGKLELLGVADGELERESQLHRLFWELRKDGEFFSPAEELITYIQENTHLVTVELPPTHLPALPLPKQGVKRKVVNRLSELMTETGVTQTDVAAGTGIPQGTVSKWYKNNLDRFDRNVMVKLIHFFKCDVNDLLAIVPAD